MKNMTNKVNQLFDSYRDYVGKRNEYFWKEWRTITNQLLENGFQCEQTKGYAKKGKTNMNIVYFKEGFPYVFVLIFTSSEKNVFPLVIDYDTYFEKVQMRNISIMAHHHRPVIAIDKKIYKLHKFVMDMENDDSKEVDHITHSSNICCKKLMRVCDRVHNRYNKKVYMTIDFDDMEFTGLFEAKTEEQKAFLNNLMHKANIEVEPYYSTESDDLYRITAYEYETDEEMIKDIKKIEKKFMQDYRYDPLLDATHPISQYLMISYLFNLISKEEFEEGQKYFMQETNENLVLDLYDIA